MNKREWIVGIVTGTIGLILGIAVCPKHTPTDLDQFSLSLSDFYEDDNRQHIKHEFLMEGVVDQAIILSSNPVRLIGVEFTISKHQYDQLNNIEKDEWYQNNHIIESGTLAINDVEYLKSTKFLSNYYKKYCKTIVFWDETDDVPHRAMTVKPPDKVQQNLIVKRDRTLKVNTEIIKSQRNAHYKRYKKS